MRPIPTFALLAWILALPIAGQSVEVAPRQAAMGGAGVAILGARWTTVNPAALAELSSASFSVHASQAFGFPELRSTAAALAWPRRSITPALELHTFGFEAFRTVTATVAAATQLSSIGGGIYGGLGLSRHHVSIAGYGAASAIAVNAGWIMTLLPYLHVGGSISNVGTASWTEYDEIPQVFRLGVVYSAGNAVVAMDLSKDARFPLATHGGLDYVLIEAIRLRAGAATGPTRVAAGMGIRVASMHVDIAAERHFLLGWTPALALSVDW